MQARLITTAGFFQTLPFLTVGVLTSLPTVLSQRADRQTIIGVKTGLHNDDPNIDDHSQCNVNVHVNVNVNVNADTPEKEEKSSRTNASALSHSLPCM